MLLHSMRRPRSRLTSLRSLESPKVLIQCKPWVVIALPEAKPLCFHCAM